MAEGGLPDLSGFPLWAQIPIIVISALGIIGAVLGPSLTAYRRRRREKATTPALPPQAKQAEVATVAAQDFMADLLRQRDREQQRADALQEELEECRANTARLQVRIAKLQRGNDD